MEEKIPEEKAPLLLYLSDTSEGMASKNNKRISFEKGRLYGISSGATAVFTEFPSLVSTCWLTTVLSALVLFMMFILMFSSMASNASYNRVPRCINKTNNTFDNLTIHLVHKAKEWDTKEIEILERIIDKFPGYKIHVLVLDLNTHKGMMHPTTKTIANKITHLRTPFVSTNQTQPLNPVNGSTVDNATTGILNKESTSGALGKNMMYRPLKRVKRRHIDDNPFDFSIKRLLDILFHPEKSVKINGSVADLHFPIETTTQKRKPRYAREFPKFYPNIIVERQTENQAFQGTPLKHTWMHLNSHLTIFAARVLQLWQNGGLSFCLHDSNDNSVTVHSVESFSISPEFDDLLQNQLSTKMISNPYDQQINATRIFNFIDTGRENYEKLPIGVVTSDEDGLHIFSKTQCHAFFGEVLLKLKRADENDTIKKIIREALAEFCRHSAEKKRYCHTLLQKFEGK